MSTFDIVVCLISAGFVSGFIACFMFMACMVEYWCKIGHLKKTEKW